jgi:DNA-binding Xre family transcriptional regulator
MKACYKKLWKLLIDKNLKRTDLKKLAGISSGSLAKLGKDENVSMDVLQKICKSLNCNIGDIVDLVPEEDQVKK